MKKFISTSLSILLCSVCVWSQIPDPDYIPSEYIDTIKNDEFIINKTSNIISDTVNKEKKIKLQPKLNIGFGNFNFIGDISDNRNSALIGQSGFQIGLSTNLNDFIDASILMEEGVVRVDGINQQNLPKNFKSTINSIGVRIDYNFKNFLNNNIIIPYVGVGLSFIKFDSKGSNDDSNNEYEIDLLSDWLLDPNNVSYSQNGIDIPISIGLNLRISERLNLKFGTSYHYTNTDYIDNIENGNSDKYIVNSAHFIYDINCYSCEEKYVPVIHDDYIAVDFDKLDKEDEDGDGIADIDDFCLATPKDINVDSRGCPLDSDNDNVPDYLDKEANTPKGAVVSKDGIQLTDEMSESIYLAYINTVSRKDANSYFEDTYPSDKFIKLTKKVVNTFGDTLMLDFYKPILYQQIYNQQKEFEEGITPAQFVDLNSKVIYKLQIAKYTEGIEAKEINRLMSIIDLKSTLENNSTVYYSGEYDDVLKARQKQKQLINSGYSNILVVEDNQGDLRIMTNHEMDKILNLRASSKLKDLPPLEDIVFRVQLDVLKDVDLDFYDLDELVVFEGKDGFKHVFTEGYTTYEEALERRNELYLLSYENLKVVGIKEGQIVEAKDYMDLSTVENKNDESFYGDVIFKVQLGIYGKQDIVELNKLDNLDGVEKTNLQDGLQQYTVGRFTSIQGAMLKLNSINKLGFKGCYIVAFYNDEQISIKKAKELIGF